MPAAALAPLLFFVAEFFLAVDLRATVFLGVARFVFLAAVFLRAVFLADVVFLAAVWLRVVFFVPVFLRLDPACDLVPEGFRVVRLTDPADLPARVFLLVLLAARERPVVVFFRVDFFLAGLMGAGR